MVRRVLILIVLVGGVLAACAGDQSDQSDIQTELIGKWREPETGVFYEFDSDGTGHYGVTRTQYQWLSDSQIEIETEMGKVKYEVSIEDGKLMLIWQQGGTEIVQTFERELE